MEYRTIFEERSKFNRCDDEKNKHIMFTENEMIGGKTREIDNIGFKFSISQN